LAPAGADFSVLISLKSGVGVRTLLLSRNTGFEVNISEATQPAEFHFPHFLGALLSVALAMKPPNFFAELKRRNVYKVAVAYAVVGWLLIQVTTQVFPFFEIPNWAVGRG
jgi:hypothetical protein